jgi:hypothetical protein
LYRLGWAERMSHSTKHRVKGNARVQLAEKWRARASDFENGAIPCSTRDFSDYTIGATIGDARSLACRDSLKTRALQRFLCQLGADAGLTLDSAIPWIAQA